MPKISLQAAHVQFGLSERTIRRYVDQGLLPAYRLGPRLLRVDTADLEQLLRPVVGAQPDRGDAA